MLFVYSPCMATTSALDIDAAVQDVWEVLDGETPEIARVIVKALFEPVDDKITAVIVTRHNELKQNEEWIADTYQSTYLQYNELDFDDVLAYQAITGDESDNTFHKRYVEKAPVTNKGALDDPIFSAIADSDIFRQSNYESLKFIDLLE